MKSSYAFAALVGFALLNTAFLGVYLYSSAGLAGGPSFGPAGTQSSTTTLPAQTTTATITSTIATSATSPSTTGATPGSSPTNSTEFAAISSVAGSSSSVPGLSFLSVLQFFESHSLALAPSSWAAVGGMWIWRGRMRSRWSDLGFDSDVFGLFVKMKGGKTRIRLLDALDVPKDRLQLAQELGLDWKGVDRHLMLMKKYGFVDDRVVYGKVRMYELTPIGVSLMKLLQELSKEERRDDAPGREVFLDQSVPR
ncbi:MAG: hypothetical protein ABSG45_05790 [Nitrososphaerales archaeon]